MNSHPVAITGYGAVTAHGWCSADLWRQLYRGQVGISDFDLFDHSQHRTHLAAQVGAAQVGAAQGSAAPPTLPRIDRRASRSDRFAIAAAAEAVEHAGLQIAEADDATGVGVFFGSSTGGMFEAESFYRRHLGEECRRVPLRRLSAHQNNSPGDAVARHFQTSGPLETVSTACAAGSMAIGNAVRAIRRGEIDVALVGGADGLCQLTYAGFNSLRAVDANPCRPFRVDRGGLSLGEGAGVLVLESREHALGRGARPTSWLIGAAASCDAHHMTAPKKDGSGAAAAIRRALDEGGVAAADVSFVNAHGTGTPHNDAAEWNALSSVFGDRVASLPVTSTKGSVGHLLGAAGALEAVVTVMCLERSEVHPTPGGGEVDPNTAVDLVRNEPRPIGDNGIALSINLAFGGANAALVLSRRETA